MLGGLYFTYPLGQIVRHQPRKVLLLILLSSLLESLFEVLSVIIVGQTMMSLTRKRLEQFRELRRNLRYLIAEFLKALPQLGRSLIFPAALLSALIAVLLNAPLIYRTLHLDTEMSKHSVQLVVAVVVLTSGVIAYWTKRNFQMSYGLAELFFGVATAYSNANGLATKEAALAKWTALVGAIYVVSRGMNNVMEGRLRSRSCPQSTGTASPKQN